MTETVQKDINFNVSLIRNENKRGFGYTYSLKSNDYIFFIGGFYALSKLYSYAKNLYYGNLDVQCDTFKIYASKTLVTIYNTRNEQRVFFNGDKFISFLRMCKDTLEEDKI